MAKPCRPATASAARWPSGITSWPMPSPGMTAMRYLRSGMRVSVTDGWRPGIGHWESSGKGAGKARPPAEGRGSWKPGGAGRNRTDDLYNAIVALSQLSYGPMGTAVVAIEGGRPAAWSGKLSIPPVQGKGKVATSWRSDEHTSELQSLMRISSDVFCLKKKN